MLVSACGFCCNCCCCCAGVLTAAAINIAVRTISLQICDTSISIVTTATIHNKVDQCYVVVLFAKVCFIDERTVESYSG